MKVSQLIVIATLAILGSPLLFDAAATADEFSFELSTSAPVTPQDYSNTDSFGGDGTFVNSDMIGSPDKKNTCPVPPQKKKPTSKPAPKRESAAEPEMQIITHVCSPVITINMPQGTYVHPSQSFHPGSSPTVSPQSLSTEAPLPETTSANAPESFSLSFKDLFKTKLTTHHPVLLAIFMLASILTAAGGAYFIYVAAKRSTTYKSSWFAVGVFLLLVASCLAIWMLKQPESQKEGTTTDKVHSAISALQSEPIQQPNANTSAPGQELVEPHDQSAPAQARNPASLFENKENNMIETEWLVLYFLFFTVLTAYLIIACYHMIIGRSLFTRRPFNRDLPLDDLYKLETEISKMVAATNNWPGPMELRLNSLLNSINYARKFLESSGTSKNATTIQTATFFVRADKDNYEYLNQTLRKLDITLSMRSNNSSYKRRANAFKDLTDARKNILKICSVHQYDENLDFQ